MKSPLCFFISLLFFISTYAQQKPLTTTEDEWIFVGEGRSSNAKTYFRSEYVYKNGEEIKIWTKNILEDYKKDGIIYKKVKMLILLVINCSSKQQKMLSVMIYNSNGKLIDSSKDDEAAWEDVPPNTVSEELLTTVCNRFN